MTPSVKHISARHFSTNLICLVGIVVWFGCGTSTSTERSFPYILKPSVTVNGLYVPVDFAGTGDYFWVGREDDDILLRYRDWSTFDQVNFGGQIAGELKPFDVDRDGDSEIAVPLVRNDSLFVSVVDLVNGEPSSTAMVFLARGKDRQDVTGPIGWEGNLSHVLPVGSPDSLMFVALVASGKAPDGRGAYLVSLKSSSVVGSAIVGGSPVWDLMNHPGASVLVDRPSALEGGLRIRQPCR